MQALEYRWIFFSDEIMTKWSWTVQRIDPKIAKWAIGSQYNKVDPRVATVIVFHYRTRKIYSKVYQGESNTLTLPYLVEHPVHNLPSSSLLLTFIARWWFWFESCVFGLYRAYRSVWQLSGRQKPMSPAQGDVSELYNEFSSHRFLWS